jgi:hypothetical protein
MQTFSNREVLRCYEEVIELDAQEAREAPATWEESLAQGIDEFREETPQSAPPVSGVFRLAKPNGAESRMRSAAALRRARWYRRMSEAAFFLGDLSACLQHATTALELLGFKPPQTPGGWTLALLRDFSVQLRHRLRAGARPPQSALDRAVFAEASLLMQRLSERFYYNFDALPMIAASLAAVNLGERAATEVQIAKPYGMLGMTVALSKLHRLGHRYFELGHEVAHQTNDQEGLTFCLYAKAAWLVGDGRWEEVPRPLHRGDPHRRGPGRQAGSLDRQDADRSGRLLQRSLRAEPRSLPGDRRGRPQARQRPAPCLGALRGGARAHPAGGAGASPAPAPGGPPAPRAPGGRALQDHHPGAAGGGRTPPRRRHGSPGDGGALHLAHPAEPPHGFRPQWPATPGVAEVYLARWERLRARGDAGAKEAEKIARRAVFDLLTLAFNIPIGWPYYHRIKGVELRLLGQPEKAAAACRKGAASARELAMPHDEALNLLELARSLPRNNPERARSLDEAERLFEDLRCPLDQQAAQAAR